MLKQHWILYFRAYLSKMYKLTLPAWQTPTFVYAVILLTNCLGFFLQENPGDESRVVFSDTTKFLQKHRRH